MVDGGLVVLVLQVEGFATIVGDDHRIEVVAVVVALPSSDHPGGFEAVLDHLFQSFLTVTILGVLVADCVAACNGLAIGDCDREPFRVLCRERLNT